MNDPIRLYLDLMKKCLTRYLRGETTESAETDRILPFRNTFLTNKISNFLKKMI